MMNSSITIDKRVRHFATYLKYKDSGIEWLGEIPEGWEVKPLKRTFTILNGATPRSGEPDYWDGDIAWATPDDLGSLASDTLQITRRMITQEGYKSCGTTLAPAGSLILSTRAPIGHLAIAGVPLCTNQGCRCLVFREKAQKRFYYNQLLITKQELESWGQGSTFKELGRDRLAVVYLVSPPVSEQHAIASFLDRETSRIDTLISKKQRQIKLLQEKRSALISHAVTKGLDPNLKMKDSGIEWLGEIPEGWEVIRLKYIATINDEALGENTSSDYEILYVDISSVDSEYGIINKEPMLFEKAPSRARRKVREGDVIISTVRTYLRAIAPITETESNLIVSTGFAVIRPSNKFDSTFASYALRATYFVDTIVSRSVGVSYPAINASEICTLPIILPLIEEQRTIASFLDRETSRIDAIIEKVKTSIDKLREYRTALISATVTGKIDVRKEDAR